MKSKSITMESFDSYRNSNVSLKKRIHSKCRSGLKSWTILCLLAVSFLFVLGNHTYAMGAIIEDYSGVGTTPDASIVNGLTPYEYGDFTYQITEVSGPATDADLYWWTTWSLSGSPDLGVVGAISTFVTTFKIKKTDGAPFDVSSLWIAVDGNPVSITGYNDGVATAQTVTVSASGTKALNFTGVDELRFEGTEIIIEIDDFTYTLAPANSAPTITTTTATSITATTATLGGNVTSDGGAAVTERGVVYSISDTTPTIAEGATKDVNGSGTGIFSKPIGSLTPGITYYYTAYATNSVGTTYATASNFITLSPEINIKGNNISIADGDATPATEDHSDFGSIDIDGAFQVRTFTIENTGTSLLTLGLNAVSITGADAADFTVTTQPATSVVAAGATTTFQISFDPSALGIRSAAISVANDDSNENPYNFTVQGTGIFVDNTAPTISSITILDSAHKVGDTVTATITVTADTDDYTTGSGAISGIIDGYSLSSLSKSNDTTYTATFTITDGGTDVAAGSDIAVNVTLTDSVGNTSDAFTTAINQASDAIYANLPDVNLSADTNTIAEDGGTATLTATLSGSLNNQWPTDITVNLAYTGTATATTDYIKSNSFSISSGSTTATTTVIGIADSIYDAAADETAIVDISSLSIGNEGVTNQQTITITDAESAPTVTLSTGSSSVAENGGTSAITATLSTATYANVTVNLSYSGTATAGGVDYSTPSSSITILAGSLAANTMTAITAVDDALTESDETIIIDISSVSGGDASENGTQQQTVTIVDDEDGTAPTINGVSIGNSVHKVGDTVTATITVTADTDDYTTGSGAISGTIDGYSLGSLSKSNDTTYTATFIITDGGTDVAAGSNVAVNVTLTDSVGNTSGAFTTAINQDSDAIYANLPVINFSTAASSIAEVGAVSTVTATLSGSLNNQWPAAVTLPFTINGSSTATGGGTDYAISASPVTITAGSSSADISITISADQLSENSETIIVDMGTPTNAIKGTTTSHTATITDNDAAGFSLNVSDGKTEVSESATTDSFTLALTAQPQSNVVLTLSNGDTGEVEINKSTLTFTTANWNIPQIVTASGVDDLLVDGNQNTTISIQVNAGLSNDHFDALPAQTVTITTTDNDVAGFTIGQSGGTTEVSELATTDSFTLVLDSMPISNVVLTITCQDPTEVTATPSMVTFTPGNWNNVQTVSVTGVDDDEIDGLKITTVTAAVLDASSDDAFDSLADQSISVVTRDNDAPLVVANPIADVAVVENSANTVINLSTTFENPNDSSALIVKSVFANSNSSLVTASIGGNTLTLSYQTDQLGTSTITVRATSNGKTVDDSFDITVQSVQDLTFEKIQQYAATSDASLLTVAELITAGVIEVDAANLDAYKQTISAQTEITSLATLQTLIYQVNALERIKAYALSSDASPLTMDELFTAGVEGALAEHLELYQQEIAALESLADLAALQALIDQVHALVTIQGYVAQADAAEMKLAELQLTGTEDLYFYNLPAYRLAIELTSSIDSLLALQELIDAANLASALDQGAAAITLPAIVDEEDTLDQLKQDDGCTMTITDDEGEEKQVVLFSQLLTLESVDQDSEVGRITFTNTFDGSQLSTVIDEQGFIEQQVQTADGNEGGVSSMWLDILARTSAAGIMTLQATIPYTDSFDVTIPLEITTTLLPTGTLQAQVQRNPAAGESPTSTLTSEGVNGSAVIQADGSLLMMLETTPNGNQVSATGHIDTAGRVDGIVVQSGVETHVHSLLPGSDVTVLDDGWLQLRSTRVIDFTAATVHGDRYDDLYFVDVTEHRVLYANADITDQGVLWTGFTLIHNGELERQYDTLATTANNGFSNRFPAQASATITTADNGDPRLTIITTLQVPLQF